MALPGETIASGGGEYDGKCPDCGADMPLKVCQSAAGYYVGTWCDGFTEENGPCGPYSRESGYYRTRELAQAALDSGQFGRSTKFGGK